ncbi:MAG TPA: YciI family protein [Steroidobacteraceae bacterium]|nr:YciI family protein [Steroidobacteraceae bacterium]
MNPAYMVAAVVAARRLDPVPKQEVAVQYLCLIYSEESQWPKLPRPEYERVYGEYLAYTDDVRRSGHLRGGHPLEPTSAATTVRVRNGRISTTDGPFAETKEQLGGYYLLEAKDLNEAIQLAARIPGARYGCIEVRPVMEMKQCDT